MVSDLQFEQYNATFAPDSLKFGSDFPQQQRLFFTSTMVSDLQFEQYNATFSFGALNIGFDFPQ